MVMKNESPAESLLLLFLSKTNMVMRKFILTLVLLTGSSLWLLAQDTVYVIQKPLENYLKPGFYLRISGVMPVGEFKTYKQFDDQDVESPFFFRYFDKARLGPSLDMGFLIYLGPPFAQNKLRAGIDATFLSVWYNPSKSLDGGYVNDSTYIPGDRTGAKYWYASAGQRFGALFSYNPVDRLIIDLHFQIGTHLSRYEDYWGYYLPDVIVGINMRYRVMMFTLEYYRGKTNFNGFDKENPDYFIRTDSFRFGFGVKI